MAEHGLSLWGGILIILSLFLPIVSYKWIILEKDVHLDVLRWMFGSTFISSLRDDGTRDSYILFSFDTVGVLCTILLLALAIMIIIGAFKENGNPITKWVITSVLVVISYTIWIFVDLTIIQRASSFYPTIGFFGIIFGCFLAIVGKNF